MAEPNESASFDAQTMTEAIEAGEQEAPQVDVSADYEKSKEYETSETDRTAEAKEILTPQFELHEPQEVLPESNLSSDPGSFQSMAAAVNPNSTKEVDSESGAPGDVDAFRSMAKEVNPTS
ncbi:MAG: hypothetical protein KME17_11955 [Cyanosarcina radialis HA8281-LM2]|jgi:hypothetical protein|nr:hypothetical protein [Cyanosarcina radialis HA8281-LM2]